MKTVFYTKLMTKTVFEQLGQESDYNKISFCRRKILTAPDDPPISCSTISAKDNNSWYGHDTLRLEVSRLFKIATNITKDYEEGSKDCRMSDCILSQGPM
jgi:hypothetical protein